MTGIQWTDRVWNPVIGCSKVSDGCRNCYAEAEAARQPAKQAARGRESVYLRVIDDRGRWNGQAVMLEERLRAPLGWRKPSRVFVNSMSDLFHASLSFTDVLRVFLVMGRARRHTFQVLTKRAERLPLFFDFLRACRVTRAYFGGTSEEVESIAAGLPNVWIGVSAEHQAAADQRIPHLLSVPAAARFVSAEPLLGPLDLEAVQIPDEREGLRFSALRRRHDDRFGASDNVLDWVIAGGESGRTARRCDLSWLRGLVRQCREAAVPLFVKQCGDLPVVDGDPGAREARAIRAPMGKDPAEWPEDLRVRQFPEGST